MAGIEDLAQIKCLFHFTDSRNLPLIKEFGGILSGKLLREMDIKFHSGGNQWSIDQDLRTGMDAYVHLCWDYGHPMAHNIKQRENKPKVVYLKIDKSILERNGVMFSRDVANAKDARPLVAVQEACEGGMIDYDAINNKIGSRLIRENYNRRVAAELSEILVPDLIEIDLIIDLPNG
jgi:hypothetical protein